MWIDITQTLKAGIPNWPGDTPFQFEVGYTKEQTGSVNIGKMTTSMHIGTHADAPFHFDQNGEKMDQLDVNVFIGQCFVMDCRGTAEITREILSSVDFKGVQRILFKTLDTISPQFPTTIPVIHPNVAPFLQDKGVVLVGVDNPSVDPLDSKEVSAHHALYEAGIHIVEGLVLETIEQGFYDLIALPLKVAGADGAPVRAVIRKIPSL